MELLNVTQHGFHGCFYPTEDRKDKAIAIDGISKGAELALLASSLIPDISCVIARSPSYYVCEGLGIGKNPSNASSWAWRG